MAAKKRKRPAREIVDRDDPNVMAHRILREATGEAEKTDPPKTIGTKDERLKR